MRFAILHHTDWPGHPDHYDLMLQTAEGANDDDRVVMTFSTKRDVLPDGQNREPLERGAPHRRIYLDFEGRIAGGRGNIKCVERGKIVNFCEIQERKLIQFELLGILYKGKYQIELEDFNKARLVKIG